MLSAWIDFLSGTGTIKEIRFGTKTGVSLVRLIKTVTGTLEEIGSGTKTGLLPVRLNRTILGLKLSTELAEIKFSMSLSVTTLSKTNLGTWSKLVAAIGVFSTMAGRWFLGAVVVFFKSNASWGRWPGFVDAVLAIFTSVVDCKMKYLADFCETKSSKIYEDVKFLCTSKSVHAPFYGEKVL